jgi:hypothetical protein
VRIVTAAIDHAVEIAHERREHALLLTQFLARQLDFALTLLERLAR